MNPGEETFTAFLVHPATPSLDRPIELPILAERPPVRIRVPTDSDPGAMDVYELVAADDWPREAMYRYLTTELSGS